MYDPQNNTSGTLAVTHRQGHVRNGEKLQSLEVQIPRCSRARQRVAFLFQLSRYEQVSFPRYGRVMFFRVLCFLLVSSLFETALKYSAV